jgi:hypothetical protein
MPAEEYEMCRSVFGPVPKKADNSAIKLIDIYTGMIGCDARSALFSVNAGYQAGFPAGLPNT